MRAIAEGLVLRKTATAQRNDRASRQAERAAFRIVNGEVAFQADGPVVKDSYFGSHL